MRKFKIISMLEDALLAQAARNTAIAVYAALKSKRTTAITAVNGLVTVLFRPEKNEIIMLPTPAPAAFYNVPHTLNNSTHLIASVTASGSTARLIGRQMEVDTSGMHPAPGKIGSRPLYDLAVGARYGLGVAGTTIKAFAVGVGLFEIAGARCFFAAGTKKNTIHLAAPIKAPVTMSLKSSGQLNANARLTVQILYSGVGLDGMRVVTGFRVFLIASVYPGPIDITESVNIVGTSYVELVYGEHFGLLTSGFVTIPPQMLQTGGPTTQTVSIVATVVGAGVPVYGHQYVFVGPRSGNPGFTIDQDVLQYYDYAYTDYEYAGAALCHGLFKALDAPSVRVASAGPVVMLSVAELVPYFGSSAASVSVAYLLEQNEEWVYIASGDSSQTGVYVQEGTVLASGVGTAPPLTAALIDLDSVSAGLVYRASAVAEPVSVVGLLVSTDAQTTTVISSLLTGSVTYTVFSNSTDVISTGVEATISTSSESGSHSRFAVPVTYSNRVYGVVNQVIHRMNTANSGGNRSNGFDRFMDYFTTSESTAQQLQYIKQVSLTSDGMFLVSDLTMVSAVGERVDEAVKIYSGTTSSPPSPTITTITGSGPTLSLSRVGRELYTPTSKPLGTRTIVGTESGYVSTVSGPYPVGDIKPVALEVDLAVAGPNYEMFVVGAEEIQYEVAPYVVLTGGITGTQYNSSSSKVIRDSITVTTSPLNVGSQTPVVAPFSTGGAVLSMGYVASAETSALGVATYFGSGVTNPEGSYYSTQTTVNEYLVAPEIDEGCIAGISVGALVNKGVVVIVALYRDRVVYDIYKAAVNNASMKAIYAGFDLADIYKEYPATEENTVRGVINDRLLTLRTLRSLTGVPDEVIALGNRADSLYTQANEITFTFEGDDFVIEYLLPKEALILELKSLMIDAETAFDVAYSRHPSSTHNMKEIAMRTEKSGVTYILPGKVKSN